MTDAFIGEIRALAFDYAPAGWLLCDGRVYTTVQYKALFGVIGMMYGGDSQKSTFAVPDLRNRVVVGLGVHPGHPFTLGQGKVAGVAKVPLESKHLPAHDHTLNGKIGAYDKSVNNPAGNWLGVPTFKIPGKDPKEILETRQGKRYQNPPQEQDVTLHPETLTSFGDAVEVGHNNCQPALTMAYFICCEGYMAPR